MPTVNLIVVIGARGQLGLGGALPWHEPGDLSWFKRMTIGGIVVVGWRTGKSMPDLPGRDVVIMSRLRKPEDVIRYAREREEDTGKQVDIWVAGGAATYRQWMPFVNRFFIARIAYDGPADVWMQELAVWCSDAKAQHSEAATPEVGDGELIDESMRLLAVRSDAELERRAGFARNTVSKARRGAQQLGAVNRMKLDALCRSPGAREALLRYCGAEGKRWVEATLGEGAK